VYVRQPAAQRRAGRADIVEHTSGFTISVSDADLHAFKDQVRDAIAFLETHRSALDQLVSFPESRMSISISQWLGAAM